MSSGDSLEVQTLMPGMTADVLRLGNALPAASAERRREPGRPRRGAQLALVLPLPLAASQRLTPPV
jgi:hypothetical protein